MIVHIDKLIRHLRSQIESADKVNSEFIYLTKREAEGCLELAEAQDVIQEMIAEQSKLVRCADCKNHNNNGCRFFRYGVRTKDEWFCADGERKTNCSDIPNS